MGGRTGVYKGDQRSEYLREGDDEGGGEHVGNGDRHTFLGRTTGPGGEKSQHKPELFPQPEFFPQPEKFGQQLFEFWK